MGFGKSSIWLFPATFAPPPFVFMGGMVVIIFKTNWPFGLTVMEVVFLILRAWIVLLCMTEPNFGTNVGVHLVSLLAYCF